MIYLKTEEEIELLRENNLLVSRTLAEVGRHIAPGVTTKGWILSPRISSVRTEQFLLFSDTRDSPLRCVFRSTKRWCTVFRHPREFSVRETSYRWIAVRL